HFRVRVDRVDQERRRGEQVGAVGRVTEHGQGERLGGAGVDRRAVSGVGAAGKEHTAQRGGDDERSLHGVAFLLVEVCVGGFYHAGGDATVTFRETNRYWLGAPPIRIVVGATPSSLR